MPIIIDAKYVDPYVLKADRELPPSTDHPAKYAAEHNEILTRDDLRALSGMAPDGLHDWIESANAKRSGRRWIFRLGIPRPHQRAVIRDQAKPDRAAEFKLGSWEYHTVRASLRAIDGAEGCQLTPPEFSTSNGELVPDHVLAILTTADMNELTNRVTDMLQARADDLGN